jgi:hypothetical protein
MELLINKRSLLIIATALVVTACSEDKEMITSSESVAMRFNESKEWNMSHPSRDIIVESDDYSILAMADIHG